MKSIMQLFKHLILFLVGAGAYYFIEVLWDGNSHWTMALLGGICFIAIGLINEFLSWDTPMWIQALIGSVIVTILEFVFGCVLNIWLKLGIWDYSQMPLNIFGQVCLVFSMFWFFLSILAILLDDYLRYWLFGEEEPHYKLF